MKKYLGFLCERGVYEYPLMGGGHSTETVYRVLNESKECVHTIYVLRGESVEEFEDIVLRHKYNLFAKKIDEDCFSPLLAEERSGHLYAGSVKDYIGKIDFKKGLIFDRTLSLETKEVLARKLQPMFERNRGVSQTIKEKEMLNRLGWK